MKLLIILFLVLLHLGCVAQPSEVKRLLDTTISIMKQNAVNSKKLNWAVVERNAYKRADTSVGDAIKYLYQSLNDYHGYFYYVDNRIQWIPKKNVVPDNIMNEWKKGVKAQTFLLHNSIGYLRVPGMSFADQAELNKKAQDLNDSLCHLLQKGVKGIILDLRLNGGGAMFPMILGLEQLLGERKLGSFYGKKITEWMLKDDKFYLDTMVTVSIVPKCSINAEHIPVVLLTGSQTGSSGEFLIIAFKGRKNIILLGEKTIGYITSTQGYPLEAVRSYMLLSTSYGADRNGKLYTTAITPDIKINAPDKFNDIPNDEKVKAAMKWLRQYNK
jgi:carboxyl-terminal processing protease